MPSASSTIAKAARALGESPLRGPADLTILGGAFDAHRLSEFLDDWAFPRDNLPYCLWEAVRDWAFLRGERPPSDDLFERARIFGPGGDLDLRRDGERILWHYVGPAGVPTPAAFEAHDYWTSHRDTRLRAHEASTLLWGKHQDGHRWHDNRVGWAQLVYPHAPAERVWIHYTLLMDGGQVAFVWWKELLDHAQGDR